MSCAKETKCYEPNELWIALLEKTGMTTTAPMKRKNGKGEKVKKQADDMLKEKLQHFIKFSQEVLKDFS